MSQTAVPRQTKPGQPNPGQTNPGQITQRRRPRLPLLLSTSLLGTGLLGAGLLGAGLLGVGGFAVQQTWLPLDREPTPGSFSLDAVAQSWSKDSWSEAATNGDNAPAEPGFAVVPAAYNPPLVGGRYANTSAADAPAPVTRGQSPPSEPFRNSSISRPVSRPVASIEPAVGNPLRPETTPAVDPPAETLDAEAARRAFGEVLAADAAEPRALPPPTAVAPAAFEDEAAAEAFAEPAPLETANAGPATPLMPPTPVEPFASSTLPLTPVSTTPAGSLPSLEALPQVAPSQPQAAETNSLRAPAPAPSLASLPEPRGFGQPPTGFQAAPITPSGAAAGMQPVASPPVAPLAPAPATLPGSDRPGDRAMEGRQQPSLAIQKFAPAEVQVGKPARFVTKVRNVGGRPAVGVVVSDKTPAGAKLMSTTPSAGTRGDQIVWQLGTLSPGEERTLEMEITPVEEGDIGSVATVSFAAHASAKSRCTRPQLAIRMTAPERVLVGRQQRVQIELHNPGTGDATGVVLTENVPENLRHEAGPALEFEVGALRAGETRTLELVMNAESAGHVVNVLTAKADGAIEVEQKVEFDVVAPELAVDVAGPKRRYLERPATYTVSIENPGTAAAKDVRLVTRLPQGMRFVKANNLGEYDAATHSVYWSLAELPEGQQGAVELTALPVTSGDLTIQVEGQAQEGLRDETAMAVKVEGIAAINFEVLDVEDPIEVGGETLYEIRVTNQGTKAAANVTVRAVLPAGMSPIEASSQTRHAVEGNAVVFTPLDRLAPQGEALYRVRVRGVQPGDQRLTVEVGSDDLSQPVRKEESTRVFGDE